MKYLLLIVLLVTVILTDGCISEKDKTIVTPTQTSIQIPSPHQLYYQKKRL
jgi:hypothetical protein